MTRPLTLSLALLALAGCAPDSGSVTLMNFHALLAGCAVPKTDSPLWGNGSLDLAIDPTNDHASAYYVGLILHNTLSTGGTTADITVGGTQLEGPSRDVPVLDEKVLTYTAISSAPLPRIAEYHEAINLKFDVGSSSGNILVGGENLISSDPTNVKTYASEALRQFGLAAGDRVDLRARIEYRGHMSRSGVAITTGVNVAPLIVTNTTPVLNAAGTNCTRVRSFANSCPAPGQDLSPTLCCDGVLSGTLPGCP